jgi:hypothetical protein
VDRASLPGRKSVRVTRRRDGEIFRTAGCGAARPVVWEPGPTLTGQSRRPDSADYPVFSISRPLMNLCRMLEISV